MDSQDKVAEDFLPEIMNEYKDVYLDIDIMFVNVVAFLTAILRHLCMIYVRTILDRKHNRVKDAIKTLQTLISRSPSSDAALTARERIRQLKPNKS